MAAGYTYLEHTADVGIAARGSSRAQIFEQAAAGLIALFLDPSDVRCTSARKVGLSGDGDEELLYHWLSEILFLFDGRRFAPAMTRVERIDGHRLRALVIGEAFDPARHTTRTDVKAITYHQLSVHRAGKLWRATVFVDI